MKKYICLRDDDTNYHTTFSELKTGYGEIWGKYPITLATVPFAHGSEKQIMEFDKRKDKYLALRDWEKNATAEELARFHTLYPIGDNKELVIELKKRIADGTVEIAQHGVTHKFCERGAEMYRDRVSFEDIRSGKEYLEKVFDIKINTFIPPGNSIDEQCVEYISKLGMVLFCSGSVKYSSKSAKLKTLIKYPESTVDKLKSSLIHDCRPIRKRNGALTFGSITYNAFDEYEDILKRVLADLDNSGFVALGTHYRLLSDEKYRNLYLSVIRELSSVNGAEFVTATEYYKKMKEKYYE